MLHILLLILKIVGIILAVVLCLVILAAVVLILNPVVYRFEASAEEWADTIRGRLKFHWLMHLIRGEVSYEGGEWQWDFRIGWKRIGDGGKEQETQESENAPSVPEEADSSASVSDQAETADAPAPELAEASASTQGQPEISTPVPERADEEEKSSEETSGTKEKSGEEKKETPQKQKKTLYEKICGRIERAKYTFRRSCDKIRSLMKKKDRLTAFLTNETHKRAFHRAVREIRRFLGFLFPKKLEAEVRFGFEDPAYTGYLLAWISMIYPAIGEHIDLEPDFQHKVLKGNIYAEGKIRVLYVLIPIWNLVWDKDVRITFRRIRKLKR